MGDAPRTDRFTQPGEAIEIHPPKTARPGPLPGERDSERDGVKDPAPAPPAPRSKPKEQP